MTRYLVSPCIDCGALTRESRCALCARSYEYRRRSSPCLRGYDRQYRRDRLAVLGQPCALRLPGCTGTATQADHLIPVSQGGAGGPLRPACGHCNASRGNRK